MSQVCNVCGYASTPARNCARCGGQNTMRDDRQREIEKLQSSLSQATILLARSDEDRRLLACRIMELVTRLAAWEPVVRRAAAAGPAGRISRQQLWDLARDVADLAAQIPPEHRPEVEP